MIKIGSGGVEINSWRKHLATEEKFNTILLARICLAYQPALNYRTELINKKFGLDATSRKRSLMIPATLLLSLGQRESEDSTLDTLVPPGSSVHSFTGQLFNYLSRGWAKPLDPGVGKRHRLPPETSSQALSKGHRQ